MGFVYQNNGVVGPFVRAIRVEAGLTQAQLALILGVPHDLICRLERHPLKRAELIFAAARACGYEIRAVRVGDPFPIPGKASNENQEPPHEA